MNKKEKVLRAMVLILSTLCMIGICGCGDSEKVPESSVPVQGVTEKAEGAFDVERDGYVGIETPYGLLEYPDNWKDYLKYEKNADNDEYYVTFYCNLDGQDIELFRVRFGRQGTGDMLGYIKAEGGQIGVSLESVELVIGDGITQENEEIIYAMAEAANDVVQSIRSNEFFVENLVETAAVYGEGADSIKIEAPYCVLEYPAYWVEYLKYEEGGTDVFSETFYCTVGEKDTHLFTVYFGDPERGVLIGYITKDSTKYACSVESNDFTPDDTWTEEDSNIVYAMSECINYVIESVMACENYSIE